MISGQSLCLYQLRILIRTINGRIFIMKRIILTGGGTAGHVTPNIALLPRLRELQYDIHYIGSYNGMKKRKCMMKKVTGR